MICSRVTGILILIDSLGCLKEVKTMDMLGLENVNFQIVIFLIFSNIYCRYNVYLQYVFSINEIFTISLLKQILNHFHLFKEMSM